MWKKSSAKQRLQIIEAFRAAEAAKPPLPPPPHSPAVYKSLPLPGFPGGGEEPQYSREGRTKDYWTCPPGQAVRVHIKPRQALFTPVNTGCPIPISRLSQNRTTRYCHHDEPRQTRVDVWTDDKKAHENLGFRWIGETTFQVVDSIAPGSSGASTLDQELASVGFPGLAAPYVTKSPGFPGTLIKTLLCLCFPLNHVNTASITLFTFTPLTSVLHDLSTKPKGK